MKHWTDPFSKDQSRSDQSAVRPTGDLAGFAPGGDPENLNVEAGQKPEAEAEVNAALAEFGGITKAGKLSSLKVNAQKIDIPTSRSN